ncbi:MAG: S8 family serine peptidase, partial [Desulfotomaculales bacterium]
LKTARLKPVFVFFLVALFFAAGLSAAAYGEERQAASQRLKAALSKGPVQEFVPGEVIVKFKEETPEKKTALVRELAFSHQALGLKEAGNLPFNLVIYRSSADVRQAVEALKNDPRVEYAQPNYIYRTRTNDPLFPAQWGLVNPTYGVGAQQAWGYTTGSSALKVAVVDSGIDYNHPDLAANIWRDQSGNPGYDFVNKDNDPMDDNGHGTHVAGIIAAAAGNGQGVAGTAPGVKIMAIKVIDYEGKGTTADLIQGINYAVQNGAKIVNLSLGYNGQPDYLLYNTLKNFSGTLFCVAAGNEGKNNDQEFDNPGSYTIDWPQYGLTALPNVISVAALADPGGPEEGGLAGLSNRGPLSVALAAPGENVLSTVPLLPENGAALAVSNGAGYNVVFWGFGAEDLKDNSMGFSTTGAVYNSVIRTVYGFLGITPQETASRPILLVDDDQAGTYLNGTLVFPDVEGFYKNALSTAGYVYQVYTVPEGGNGPSVSGSVYSGVIWITGHAIVSNPENRDLNSPTTWVPNLTGDDQNNLINYLQNDGKLFLAGCDAGFLIEGTIFYKNWLNAQFIEELLGPGEVDGIYGQFAQQNYFFKQPPTNPEEWSFFDILRPGGDKAKVILVYQPYCFRSGTSMAAPFVSAGAALVSTLRPDFSPAQIVNTLKNNTTSLPALAGKVASGGTLNIAR